MAIKLIAVLIAGAVAAASFSGCKLIGVMLSGIKGGDCKEMVLLVLELCCLRTLGSYVDNAI